MTQTCANGDVRSRVTAEADRPYLAVMPHKGENDELHVMHRYESQAKLVLLTLLESHTSGLHGK